MSPTEFQEYVLIMEQNHKHIRHNMKTVKETIEYVATKYNIHIPKE